MTTISDPLKKTELGKPTVYSSHYDPDLLFPIARYVQREKIGVATPPPFKGVDVWNAFEVSWLNNQGKPEVAVGEFVFPCESPNIIESKSLKLYLNSLNHTPFVSTEKVSETLQKDLSEKSGTAVSVLIQSLYSLRDKKIEDFDGHCLDSLEVTCDTYVVNSDYLQTNAKNKVEEVLYSHLLRSRCPVTGQPDWGSVQIHYRGKKINPEGLLRYIISFRNHQEFHESCVERMFMDILRRCAPEMLTVHARYTRRGGLDINPIRSTERVIVTDHLRLARQ